jgi:hypothetical protein
MTKKTISERLRALASDDKKRTKAARLRDVIDDVEAALAAGVSRAAVVDELKANNLELTMRTFETMLRRIRAKRGKSVHQPPGPTAAVPVIAAGPAPSPSPAPDSAEPGSHNPAALDQIIGSKPDLNALAKLGRRRTTK